MQAAVGAFGLKTIAGSDGEMQVHEDVEAMSKAYKTGDSLPFTASLNAVFDPERKSSTEGEVVDAEIVQEESS